LCPIKVEVYSTTFPPHSRSMGNKCKERKTHLKTVINGTLLSFQELYTVFSQIETILNSHPLCSLSNASELDILTPRHFLIETLQCRKNRYLSTNRISRTVYYCRKCSNHFGNVGRRITSPKCNNVRNGRQLCATPK